MDENRPLIELKDIYKIYQMGSEEVRANDGISLSIEKGEFVAIVGKSGSGKSTLAKLIMGIEHPTGGNILLDGEDITDWSITKRAQHGVSFAFQQPVRFKGITVRDLISLAAGKRLSVAQACEYLSQVGLCAKDYITREVNASLSGGERQRLGLARMFLHNAPFLLLDEPTSNLDSLNEAVILKSLHDERKEKTILLVSHRKSTMRIADTVYSVESGRMS